MMTIDEKIEVLQHYKNGGKVQSRYKDSDKIEIWEDAYNPEFNFRNYDFRAIGETIKIDKVEVAKQKELTFTISVKVEN